MADENTNGNVVREIGEDEPHVPLAAVPPPHAQLVQWLPFVDKFETKHQDVDRFIDTINNIGCLAGWTDTEKVTCAKLRMSGDAVTVLKANPQIKECQNWKIFVEFLRKYFKAGDNKLSALERFYSCTQRQGENVREYSIRLRLASSGIMATGPDAEEGVRAKVLSESLLAQFLKGLRGPVQRFVLSKSPKNFDEAVLFSEQEEQNELMVGRRSYNQVTSESRTVKPAYNYGNGNAERHFGNQTANRQYDRKGYGNVQCYKCNNFGHIARECPTISKNKYGNGGRENANIETRRFPYCSFCQRSGHTEAQCFKKLNVNAGGNRGREEQSFETRRIPSCQFCMRSGHTEDMCFRKRDLNPQGNQPRPLAGEPQK